MPDTNAYKNWRVVTEADFVSLFIKTWFAYISTLRVMFPEARNKRGDGKYLNCYKSYYKGSVSHRLVIDDIIMNHIETVYSQGRKIIMEQYPEYYLWDFYRINDNFKYTYKDIPPDKSECLIIGLKMNRNRGSKWGFTISGFIRFFGKYYGKDYNENAKFSYDLSEVLNSVPDYIKTKSNSYERDFLHWLLDKISKELSHKIIEAYKQQIDMEKYGKRLFVKIGEIEKKALSIVWSIFSLNEKDESQKTIEEMQLSRDTYEIINQLPLNYFQYHFSVPWQPNRDLTSFEESWYNKLLESRRQKSILWFLDFVYRLRNALFHEIIDPLDTDWQLVFKNAYLVLKEIVDLNVKHIERNRRE